MGYNKMVIKYNSFKSRLTHKQGRVRVKVSMLLSPILTISRMDKIIIVLPPKSEFKQINLQVMQE